MTDTRCPMSRAERGDLLMIKVLASLFLAFAPSPARAQAVSTSPPVRSGAVSTVTLLSVGRDCETGELKRVNSAGDCLNFHFAIVRRPGAAGFFTLSELKDFLVDGQKYSAMTQRALGHKPSANTVVDDPEDYKTRIRPDLASLVPTGSDDNEALMYTLISGAALQTGARGQLTID